MALRARAEERTVSEWIRLLVASKLKFQEGQAPVIGPEQLPESSVGEGAVQPEPVATTKDEWEDLLAGIDSFEEGGR